MSSQISSNLETFGQAACQMLFSQNYCDQLEGQVVGYAFVLTSIFSIVIVTNCFTRYAKSLHNRGKPLEKDSFHAFVSNLTSDQVTTAEYEGIPVINYALFNDKTFELYLLAKKNYKAFTGLNDRRIAFIDYYKKELAKQEADWGKIGRPKFQFDACMQAFEDAKKEPDPEYLKYLRHRRREVIDNDWEVCVRAFSEAYHTGKNAANKA